MIILDKNHVKEAYTVVASSADTYSLLFEHTHTGSGLASVKHFSL